MMRRLGWRTVELMARALDPDERQAVLGDVAETGEPFDRALWDICGLVIRREAALWATPHPWLILIGVVVPLGLLISVLSTLISGETRVYVWMYANNWEWALVRNVGFWRIFSEASTFACLQYLMLACYAWTIGLVVGAVSGKVFRSSAVAMLLVLLAGLSFAPRYLAFCWQLRNALFHLPVLPASNDPVSANFFYRLVFPLIVQTLLVAAPALCGVAAAGQFRVSHPLLRACMWMAAIATVGALLVREPGFGLLFYRHSLASLNGPISLLELVAYWPIPYLLTIGIRARPRPSST